MTLIGYWPLNEASGNTAYDHSGNENHGTINDGGDSTVPGANGILGQNAYSFDGSNDYVDLGNNDSMHGMSSITISVWVYLGSTNSDMVITAKGDLGDSSSAWSMWFDQEGNSTGNPDTISWDLRDGSGNAYKVEGSPDLVSSNNWYHVVAVWEKGRELLIFVNGQEESSSTEQADVEIQENSYNITIGSSQDNERNFNGLIDELRIYDRPLTQSEIQCLYSVGKRGLQTTGKKSS